MKKITGLLIFCLCFSYFTAFAQINIDEKVYIDSEKTIHVKGNSTDEKNITSVLKKIDKGSESNTSSENIMGLCQKKANENGNFEFDITLDDVAPSGWYKIYINGNEFVQEIYYADDKTVSNLLDKICNSTEETIQENILYCITEEPILPLDAKEITEENCTVFLKSVKESHLSIKTTNEFLKTYKMSQKLNDIKKLNQDELLKELQDSANILCIDSEKNFKFSELNKYVQEKVASFIYSRKPFSYTGEFTENYKEAVVLSVINSDRANVIMKDIEKYKSIIKYSEDAYKKSDKNYVAKMMVDMNFNSLSELKYQLDEAMKYRKKDPGSSTGRGGTGGGGGTGGSGGSRYEVPYDESANTLRFKDLSDVEWASKQISEMADKNIINGVSKDRFDPLSNITREQFACMIVRAFDLYDEGATCDAVDCNKDEYYYPYIASGIKAGILKGISETEFGIGKNITRQDMALMLFRAVTKKQIKLNKVRDYKGFSDNTVSDYAFEAVKKLYESQIIKGFDDNSFRGKDFANRAQAACILYEILK